MTFVDPSEDELLIAKAISDISQVAFCAGWVRDCEYMVWDLATNRRSARSLNPVSSESDFGQGSWHQLDPLLDVVLQLATNAGRWVRWDDELDVSVEWPIRGIDLTPWEELFNEWTSRWSEH